MHSDLSNQEIIITQFSSGGNYGLCGKIFRNIDCVIYLGLLIVAWIQVNKFRDQVKADFLYRIYKDMLEWLKNHKEVRDWIFETKETLTREKYESWELDEFLSFFEMIWSFDKKGLVDQDTVYDLFSDFLISAYEANDFALKKIIQVCNYSAPKAFIFQPMDVMT